jgi:hypothetical protein
MKFAPHLDFSLTPSARRQRDQRFWWLLCAVVLCLVSWNMYRYQEIQDREQSLRLQLQKVSQASQTKVAQISPQQNQTLQSLRLMLQHLSMPWEPMLSALEAASTPVITVESLQPRAAQSAVTLTANAPDFQSLSDLVAALARQPVFDEVFIQSESVSDATPATWQAVIVMKWVASK